MVLVADLLVKLRIIIDLGCVDAVRSSLLVAVAKIGPICPFGDFVYLDSSFFINMVLTYLKLERRDDRRFNIFVSACQKRANVEWPIYSMEKKVMVALAYGPIRASGAILAAEVRHHSCIKFQPYGLS